jgi:hypothetical protein
VTDLHLPGLEPDPAPESAMPGPITGDPAAPPGWPVVATGCYRRFRPEHGYGVVTSVGKPKGRPAALVSGASRTLTPFGIFPKFNHDAPEYRRRFLARLDSAGAETIRLELLAIGEGDLTTPHVLLCWCNLTGRGDWCHRHLAAHWLSDNVPGLRVAEIG